MEKLADFVSRRTLAVNGADHNAALSAQFTYLKSVYPAWKDGYTGGHHGSSDTGRKKSTAKRSRSTSAKGGKKDA